MSERTTHRGRRCRRAALGLVVTATVMGLAGAAEKPADNEQDVQQILRNAKQQLQKAQQASEQAAEARQEAREALNETLKAYETSAKQQDATHKQITELTKALKAYTDAVDRLAQERRNQPVRVTRAPQEQAQQDGSVSQSDSTQTAKDDDTAGDKTTSDQTQDDGEDTQVAMQETGDGETADSEATDSEGTDDETTGDGGDGATAMKTIAAPPEIANGPIAPKSQAPTALWNDEVSEKQVASKILGAEGGQNSCAKCHTLETEAWKQTHHFTGFQETHRTDRARQILRNMDQRSMKYRNETCRKCHYTSTVQRDRIRPVSGVSCESCHGAGEDWVKIHNRIGGDPDAKVFEWGQSDETPEQRQARLDKARKKGMNHSGMLYELASRCVKCHTVPNEELVNKGDHKAGSDFDLVSWSQGEVRHNFLSSEGAPDNPTNQPADTAKRRMMLVIGTLANLEYTLRNLAHVENKGGEFHKAMIKRANSLRGKLAQITGLVELPAVSFALKQVPKGIDADTTIPEALPDAIQKAGRRFEARHNGDKLAALDELLPDQAKGEPHKAP